jgi:hypothetical protein
MFYLRALLQRASSNPSVPFKKEERNSGHLSTPSDAVMDTIALLILHTKAADMHTYIPFIGIDMHSPVSCVPTPIIIVAWQSPQAFVVYQILATVPAPSGLMTASSDTYTQLIHR